MGVFKGFARHPQSVWLRRMLFQVHLWVGLSIGLYIFIISLSGSLIVFRRELDRMLCPPSVVTTASGRHITVLCEPAFISTLAEFHDHLAGGRTGLLLNGLGAIAVALMCLSGGIIWWQGRSRWRRGLTVHRGVSGRRFIWDLHSMLGFWFMGLLLMWVLTSLYFAFPGPFNAVDDWLIAGGGMRTSQIWEDSVAWMVRVHFGRAFGLPIEWLWVLLGLGPGALVVTGVLMWWQRVWRSGTYV